MGGRRSARRRQNARRVVQRTPPMLHPRSNCAMSVVTRARSAARLRDIVYRLPDSMWLEILKNLPGKDIGRLGAVCAQFRDLAPEVWKEASAKRWPEWYAVSDAPSGCHWRRHYEMFELRESALDVVISPPTINKLQTVVTAAHRTVLTEWLTEVAQDWELDSTILFKAVSYLDHYLSHHSILQLGRFQLCGLACLRAAMQDSRLRQRAADTAALEKELEPQRFAVVSDKTYSSDEVVKMTDEVHCSIPAHLRQAPSAKMFLRSFWYRLTAAQEVASSKMHIYTLASFFLQLSLLDLPCCGFPACATAAAALSLALSLCGQDSWPKLLQYYTALTSQDLKPIRMVICQAQASQAVDNFRTIWRSHEGEPGLCMYAEHADDWQKIIQLMSFKSDVLFEAQ